jgi:group I intron endonuclease
MHKEHYIYFITNKVNNKIYIGKTVSPVIRWKSHKSIAKQGKLKYPNKYFAIHAAIAKYGLDNFIFEIIENYPDNQSTNEAEIFWISYLKWLGATLYNETSGGDGASPGIPFTEEHKKKISLAHIGKKVSEETRINISKARKLKSVLVGEKNIKSKISEEDVKSIIIMYKTGNYTCRQLSKIYSITSGTINKIINRKLWSHVVV